MPDELVVTTDLIEASSNGDYSALPDGHQGQPQVHAGSSAEAFNAGSLSVAGEASRLTCHDSYHRCSSIFVFDIFLHELSVGAPLTRQVAVSVELLNAVVPPLPVIL